ncbi:MAG: asparagine synthase C-terminal domain-containing protein, partial [Opitutaceae bacterium]
ALLSGGIDSTLVTAFMQKNSEKPINTFTIGFEDGKLNEAPYAKAIAKHLGTKHFEYSLSLEDAKSMIPKAAKYYDEPFADNSFLPMMLLSQKTRENVTVALSGDAGDELFCGYESYGNDLAYMKIRGVASILNPLFRNRQVESFAMSHARRLVKLSMLNSRDNIINAEYMMSRYFVNQLMGKTVEPNQKFTEIPARTTDIQERHMYVDTRTFLIDDVLTKVDRASMAYGLELRAPLLDYRIVEFAFNCPLHMKYRGGQSKYILKKVLKKYVPDVLIERPKQGFGIPINKWMREDLMIGSELFLDEKYIEKQGIFIYRNLMSFVDVCQKKQDPYYEKIMWHFYVFQLWWEYHIGT